MVTSKSCDGRDDRGRLPGLLPTEKFVRSTISLKSLVTFVHLLVHNAEFIVCKVIIGVQSDCFTFLHKRSGQFTVA